MHKMISFRQASALSAFAMLVIIILFPYAKNGFWVDDALNSQTWGMINRFNSSVLDFSYRVSRTWLLTYGRVLFPWPAIYSFFYLFKSELAVRLADMALFIGHVGITALLLRRLKISWRTIGLFALALIALLQIRGADDPLAAYAGFSQSVGILLMAALLLLHEWHETHASKWLVASSLLATLSMTCYEINAIYVPIAGVVILMSRRPGAWRNLAIIIIPFIIFIVATLLAKHIALTPYDGAKIGTLSQAPATFLKQLVSTLPGSYYFFLAQLNFPLGELVRSALTSRLAWGVLILWSALSIWMLRRDTAEKAELSIALFAASMFLLVPPLQISISAKYQSSLTWGTGHVPVYYQCFGLAFLIAAAVERLSTTKHAKALALLIPLVGVYVALNWTMNMRQSALLDSAFREPRDSLVTALHQGLFDNIRDGDVVHIEGQPLFINGNLIYQTINKNVSIPSEAAIAGWFESLPRSDAKEYRLLRDPSAGNQWKVLAQ